MLSNVEREKLVIAHSKGQWAKLAQFILDYMNTCKQHNQDTKIKAY